jgi:hypothetical protein
MTAAPLREKSAVKIFAGYLTWRSEAATVYVLVWANFAAMAAHHIPRTDEE